MSVEKLFSVKINENLSKVKILWEENYIQLLILERENAWTAIVSMENILDMASQLDQDNKLYCKNLKSYLLNPEEHEFISFAVVDDEFIIYKKIDEDLRVKYFITKLEKNNFYSCSETVIDELLSKNSLLEKQISVIRNELQSKVKENAHVLEKYENLKNDIENKEKEMYSSFVLLLNEKKKRIQYLTEVLDCQKTVTAEQVKNSRSTESKLSAFKNEMDISDSDENLSENSSNRISDCDTEDEKDIKVNRNNKLLDDAVPSSSKDDTFSLFDELSQTVLPFKRKQKYYENNTISDTLDLVSSSTLPKSTKFEENDEIIDFKEDTPIEFGTQDILERL